MGGDVAYDNTVCTHHRVVADTNAAHHLATGAESDLISNARNTFSSPIRFVDQAYTSVDSAVVSYHHSVSDYDPKTRVNMKSATNDGAWMDIGTGNAAYQKVDEYGTQAQQATDQRDLQVAGPVSETVAGGD